MNHKVYYSVLKYEQSENSLDATCVLRTRAFKFTCKFIKNRLGYGNIKSNTEIWKVAIGFARIEFIKRSEGRNACQLSAYLSRSRVLFEGNCALEPQLYDFSHREKVSYEEILLPKGVDENFKIPEVLWNVAEKKEIRKDAQVSQHLVLALPDDKEITLEDRIELTKSYVQKHYVDKGLGAQVVIHPPERTIEFIKDNEALGIKRGVTGTVIEEKEGNYIVSLPKGARSNPFIHIGTKCAGIIVHENNWHAHAQLTTRRFKENGKELEDLKATDLMPIVKKGKVVSGPDNGRLWAQHQNEFFLSKGLALKVDENGLVPQEHLGPTRMRARAFALLEEHEKRLELNAKAASDPEKILSAITKRQSVFTKDDVERFILKHTPADAVSRVTKGFWEQSSIVQLRNKDTEALISKFTTQDVIKEEEHILRLSDRIHQKTFKPVSESMRKPFIANLSNEQTKAYHNILDGKRLSCIQGYAGTGKSYLLKALKDVYEERGFTIRAFGPDNATANVLKDKGFRDAENIYRFLFSSKHGLRNFHKGFEVWVLDEAGKLGNKPLLEFLKLAEVNGAKVILAGDTAQLPSVERGGLFKTFCNRYGAEVLEDIKRQQDETFRAIAKDLAIGKTGEALDKLSEKQAIKWTLTRKDAMEELILKWASDHRDSGKEGFRKALDSSIIVAHTNPEVRALNEMVRLVRKERGEISDREFGCEVISGDKDKVTIYVSEGDRIEFRKKDPELRVYNGAVGVLIKAEKNHFVVAVQENGKKTRMVSFNPTEYRAFQLGYASTVQRVQGRTVDRAYIMHSPYLNKQMAYVGLTRHIKDVHYFVPKEEARNLSDLKRKSLRDASKSTTVEYTHSLNIQSQGEKNQKQSQLQALKSSEEFTLRFKGKALSIWDQVKEKTHEFILKKNDRKIDQEFFNFKNEEKESSKGSVKEVTPEDFKQSDKISAEQVVQKVILQDENLTKNKEIVKMEHKKRELEKNLYDKDISTSDLSKSIEKSPLSHKDLAREKSKLLNTYYNAASKASELKEVVQAEYGEGMQSKENCKHFKEWQKTCSHRNESAFHLKKGLSKEEFNTTLGEKPAYFITVQADKHQEILKSQEKQLQPKNLEGELSNHIESLLHKLFPDGPSSKTSQRFRFGSKGSLSVTHSGPKAGQFYDFENDEGGGLLKLIQREFKLNQNEAKTWALEFLGQPHKVPTIFSKPSSHKEITQTSWISYKADPQNPAPKFKEIGKLHYYYQEVMRHDYRDQEGNLLYQVLRLQNKKDPSQKITPPLSYGKYQEDANSSWQLRGYKDHTGKSQLYGLEKLKTHPNATVIIVEGEKAADLGAEKFKNKEVICMSWPGGARAVKKADWSPLEGRSIVVWGDNDAPGRKAQKDVCEELQKLNSATIRAVDQEELKKCAPEKWDLGDEIPKTFGKYKLDVLLECGEKIKGNILETGKQKQIEIEM